MCVLKSLFRKYFYMIKLNFIEINWYFNLRKTTIWNDYNDIQSDNLGFFSPIFVRKQNCNHFDLFIFNSLKYLLTIFKTISIFKNDNNLIYTYQFILIQKISHLSQFSKRSWNLDKEIKCKHYFQTKFKRKITM